jgi:hypothetical protein
VQVDVLVGFFVVLVFGLLIVDEVVVVVIEDGSGRGAKTAGGVVGAESVL